jgi:hypothetical protein
VLAFRRHSRLYMHGEELDKRRAEFQRKKEKRARYVSSGGKT